MSTLPPERYSGQPRFNPVRETFRVDGVIDWDGNPVWGVELLKKTHSPHLCRGRGYCSIHNPSDHKMQEWGLIWDKPNTRLLRLCPHNIPHPDPDDARYWVEEANEKWQAFHECDGCCNITPEGVNP